MSILWPLHSGPGPCYISARPDEAWVRERPRGLCILGSTGSIGCNALRILESLPGFFRLEGLACARNTLVLAEQALRWRPRMLAVLDDESAQDLLKRLHGTDSSYSPIILTGPAGYAALAADPACGCVLSAQVGAAGLCGTLAAAFAGKVICLANKESLVLAGELLRKLCARFAAVILPVDSEHNALFQCLAGRGQEAQKLLLTASGGPFLGKKPSELAQVTAREALRHPRWKMGAKISIDSATLMNKGLELIEAVRLYGFAPEQVSVLIHPESIVHSLVEFQDRSLLAQLSSPDMRLPLAQCLCWPDAPDVGIAPLDLLKHGSLSFYPPDEESFACLGLARRALLATPAPGEALVEPGISPYCVVLNAANEAAVELFLEGKCTFLDIPRSIAAALDRLDLEQARLEPTGRQPGIVLDTLASKPGEHMAASLALELVDQIASLDQFGRACAAEWIKTCAEVKC